MSPAWALTQPKAWHSCWNGPDAWGLGLGPGQWGLGETGRGGPQGASPRSPYVSQVSCPSLGWGAGGVPPLSCPGLLPSGAFFLKLNPPLPTPSTCRQLSLAWAGHSACRTPVNRRHSRSGPSSTCSPRTEQQGCVAASVVLHPALISVRVKPSFTCRRVGTAEGGDG